MVRISDKDIRVNHEDLDGRRLLQLRGLSTEVYRVGHTSFYPSGSCELGTDNIIVGRLVTLPDV